MVQLTAVIPVADYSARGENLLKIIRTVEPHREFAEILVVFSGPNADVDSQSFLTELNNFRLCVKLLVLPNSSPGKARNSGLSMVNTSWVTFWDDDDMPNLRGIIDSLYHYSDSQVIVGQYVMSDSLTGRLSKRSRTKSLAHLAVDTGLWRIIFATDIAKESTFPDYFLGEDRMYVRELIFTNPKIIFSPNVHYKYVRSSHSLTSNFKTQLALLDFRNHVARCVERPMDTFGCIMTASLFLSYLTKSDTKLKFVTLISRYVLKHPLKFLNSFVFSIKLKLGGYKRSLTGGEM